MQIDKETVILFSLQKNSSVSQRQLARATGISLGLINVILQKFIKNGYVTVTHHDKRKFQYLLTPHGFEETFRKGYQVATATIRNYHNIQSQLAQILKNLYKAGYEYFSICGDGELRGLLETAFGQSLEDAPVKLGEKHREDERAVVLNLTFQPMDPNFRGHVVNVLEKIVFNQ